MKILKYMILVGIVLTLYITEPLWRPQVNTHTTQKSAIDKKITKHNNSVASELETFRLLEEKIGKKPIVRYKSRVPAPLEEYWNKTLKNPNSLEEEICSYMKVTDAGWITTCQYKVNGMLKVDSYTIRNGKVVK